MADRYAKDAAIDRHARDAVTGRAPRERLPEGYAEETSLAHMTRVATEARSKATTDWITAHVRPGRRYRPPPGKGVRHTQLRRAKKTLAGHYSQLLSDYAETGARRHRFGRTDTPAESPSPGTTSLRGARHGDRRRRGYGRRSVRLWGEGATGPVGAVSVGREGSGRRSGVLAHHEGGVRRSRESAPGGQGGGQ